ncbi:hypothetical protein [Corynebacterium liangguodongii]|uniref:Uncharacterized protein n=1 Tax=Corynebacterium liangguodongii TaxID=2079535 RepID=A0A2S0WGI3_9CORY|nr:hypothetical protein [Corynebacterium liangguodongii]AWB84887.1 hypothetical protein C3E79_10740 [Corynebacterium liangguodongii]PWB99405.1 hypothetical protein DF219_07535 [Corynebacterium liangguodongii]
MTHLSSSWRLWKLQFLSGGAPRAIYRVLTLCGGTLLAAIFPVVFPVWGPAVAAFIAVPMLIQAIAPTEGEYRAFGMNASRTVSHRALTVVPVALLVAGYLLLGHGIPGLAGAGVALAMGVVLIVSELTSLTRPAYARAATRLGGSHGGFAWRVLGRRALIVVAATGAASAVVEALAYTVPWEWAKAGMHAVVPFVFWMGLAGVLANGRIAWASFGLTRRAMLRVVATTAVTASLLMAAIFGAGLAALSLLGWLPAEVTAMFVLRVTALSTLIGLGVSLVTALAGGEAMWLGIALGIFAANPMRDALAGELAVSAYAWFSGGFALLCAVIVAALTWAELTGRRTPWARTGSDYFGSKPSTA